MEERVLSEKHQPCQVPALILHNHSHLGSDSPHLSLCNQHQYKATFTPHLPLSGLNVATTDLPDSSSVGCLPADPDFLLLLPTTN